METDNKEQDSNSLEGTDVSTEPVEQSKDKTPAAKAGAGKRVRGLISHLNIYLLVFILIIILVAGFTFVSLRRNQQQEDIGSFTGQELTTEDLAALNEVDTTIGDPNQTLAIESNAIFSGKVLVRDSLDVAGNLKLGGGLDLPGISVSGDSIFDKIQGNELTIAGDSTIQGTLTIQKTLSVTGGASFGGTISAPQLSVQNFQLSGDLQLNRHIDAGGPTPGRSSGSGLGNGGTSSVNGTDTSGTINLSTGSGTSSGCFVTVNFARPFNSTPHVVVTPIGSGAAGLNYYVTRTADNFTLCSTNAPPSGSNFKFDFIAID